MSNEISAAEYCAPSGVRWVKTGGRAPATAFEDAALGSMLADATEGVLLVCYTKPSAVLSTFETIARAARYGDDVAVRCSDAGVAIAFSGSHDLAIDFARKMTRQLATAVRVLSVSVISSPDSFECIPGDVTIAADDSTFIGRWAETMITEYGHDWTSVANGNRSCAVGALLDEALATVLPNVGIQHTLSFQTFE